MIVEYRVTCEAAPVQIEGRLGTGEYFYFRARHRTVSLGLGDTPESALSDPQTLIFGVEGFPDDAHIISSLSDPMPLLLMMLATRERAIEWIERRASGDTFLQQLEARDGRPDTAD